MKKYQIVKLIVSVTGYLNWIPGNEKHYRPDDSLFQLKQ